MDRIESNLGFRLMAFGYKFRDLRLPRINVLKEVGIKTGFRVLDYGCGPGSYTVALAELVGESGKVYAKESIAGQSGVLLERVGLGHRAHAYPREMSGGEKQRTALARALAGEPPIVLADEPTANLDSKTSRQVLTLLHELAEEAGKAVAIVSHDPKAEDFAHRVIVIEDGRLRT